MGSGCEDGGRIPERTSSGLHRAKLVYTGITSVQDTLLAENKTELFNNFVCEVSLCAQIILKFYIKNCNIKYLLKFLVFLVRTRIHLAFLWVDL